MMINNRSQNDRPSISVVVVARLWLLAASNKITKAGEKMGVSTVCVNL